MALDGLVIASLTKEFQEKLIGGRLYKIYQPEVDELMLVIKNQKETYRLLLSAGAGLPLAYLTNETKANPLTAPNFCMMLRKHLNNGRIIEITQPNFERIIQFRIEHLNEMGDLCTKTLLIEIMGKHSNIIFCNDEETIIDSIKHISYQVSSVRAVLPNQPYTLPPSQDKVNPLEISDFSQFDQEIRKNAGNVIKSIYSSFTGISPVVATELCFRAGIDCDMNYDSLSNAHQQSLYKSFMDCFFAVKSGAFHPNIVFEQGEPFAFSSILLNCYTNGERKDYDSISFVLEQFYGMKNKITRIRQKSTDLRKIIQNNLDRSTKKYHLQKKQLKDTDKRDKYKVYGELINTYGYELEPNAKELKAINYYNNEEVTIPLDPTLSPGENSKKYFDKYNKMKRTFEALTSLIEETKAEIEHLDSINTAMDIALEEEDLIQIKQELMEYGYVKRKYSKKKEKITSEPFHYISSDGYHMYVGKNNYQNEFLSFQMATGNDWWFHAKNMAGSHVIVKSLNEELPDRTFEEAAKLAAFYSKGKNAPKVEIDYTQKKHLKKVNGAAPGFVIYHTNYSMIIEPDIINIQQTK